MRYWLSVLLPVLLFGLLHCSAINEEDTQQDDYPFEAPSDTMLNPFVINRELGRGINMGNALDAPNEGDWGVVIKDAYFDSIKNAGFQSIRLPVRWSAHAEAQQPYTIEETFMLRVIHVVNTALQKGLSVILDMHHFNELMADPSAQTERFLNIWEQIAKRFKHYPDRLVFEILNEPNDQLTPELWNALFPKAVRVIRASNPYRTLVIGTAEWGGIGGLSKLDIPDSVANIILDIHYYNPFHFTHQGAEWVNGSDAWLGQTWSGNAQEKDAVISDLGRVVSWSYQHNRPILLGEYGAYSKADYSSRVNWTRFVTDQADAFGWSRSYWEFCSGFGIYNPQTDTFYSELLNALIH